MRSIAHPMALVLALAALGPVARGAAEEADGMQAPMARLGFVTDAQEAGGRPGLREAVAGLAEADPTLLLYGGDTSYGYGDAPDDWVAAIGPLADRTLAVRGTHDDGPRYARYAPEGANASWWSWSRDGVTVVGLDTSAPLLPGSPQREWLGSTLRARADDALVLVMHVAWWVPNAHHAAGLSFPGAAEDMDALVRDAGVDLVLAGHEHYYARRGGNGEGPAFVVGGPVEARTRPVPAAVREEANVSATVATWTLLDVLPCGVAATTRQVGGGVVDRFQVPTGAGGALRVDGERAWCEPPSAPPSGQPGAAGGAGAPGPAGAAEPPAPAASEDLPPLYVAAGVAAFAALAAVGVALSNGRPLG